jgi:hypothetical protein
MGDVTPNWEEKILGEHEKGLKQGQVIMYYIHAFSYE